MNVITTDKARICVVAVPENIKNPCVGEEGFYWEWPGETQTFSMPQDLPPGNWQFLCLYPGLESRKRKIAGVFHEYHENPIETFRSLMEANRAYLKNPFGDKEPVYHVQQKLNQQPQYDEFWINVEGKDVFFDKKSHAYEWIEKQKQERQEAQQHVSKLWVVLIDKKK